MSSSSAPKVPAPFDFKINIEIDAVSGLVEKIEKAIMEYKYAFPGQAMPALKKAAVEALLTELNRDLLGYGKISKVKECLDQKMAGQNSTVRDLISKGGILNASTRGTKLLSELDAIFKRFDLLCEVIAEKKEELGKIEALRHEALALEQKYQAAGFAITAAKTKLDSIKSQVEEVLREKFFQAVDSGDLNALAIRKRCDYLRTMQNMRCNEINEMDYLKGHVRYRLQQPDWTEVFKTERESWAKNKEICQEDFKRIPDAILEYSTAEREYYACEGQYVATHDACVNALKKLQDDILKTLGNKIIAGKPVDFDHALDQKSMQDELRKAIVALRESLVVEMNNAAAARAIYKDSKGETMLEKYKFARIDNIDDNEMFQAVGSQCGVISLFDALSHFPIGVGEVTQKNIAAIKHCYALMEDKAVSNPDKARQLLQIFEGLPTPVTTGIGVFKKVHQTPMHVLQETIQRIFKQYYIPETLAEFNQAFPPLPKPNEPK